MRGDHKMADKSCNVKGGLGKGKKMPPTKGGISKGSSIKYVGAIGKGKK